MGYPAPPIPLPVPIPVVEALGRIIVIGALVFVILIIVALLLCIIVFHTHRIILPNIALFMITLLYEPLHRVLSFFHVDPTLVDRVSVEIGNAVNYPAFVTTKREERALLLPQCIRSPECPAKLSPVDGIKCTGCGRCEIARLSAVCKELGIRMYISPGGTFTKRILISNRHRVRAIIGVACYPNLYEGMLNVKLLGIPAQGVPLKTTGCVNTSVDIQEIIAKCKLGTSGIVLALALPLTSGSAMDMLYLWVGAVFIYMVMLSLVLILIAGCLAVYKRELFPRFTLLVLNLFYHPAKLLLGYLRVNHIIVDEIGIALMNSLYRAEYERTDLSRRILFLPQCLRSLECPAKTSPQEGILCKACGRCGIGELKRLCDALGVEICIAPGGEFVKRAIRYRNPQAALGVACQHDLYEAMRYVTSRGIPMIGVVLTRSGCISTDVNWSEVKRAICASVSAPGIKYKYNTNTNNADREGEGDAGFPACGDEEEARDRGEDARDSGAMGV